MKNFFSYFKLLPFGKAIKYTGFYAAKKFLGPNAKIYYSQHGEDGIIQNLIGRKNGFYIDVGCNHPVKESNTFSFYLQQGWRGINIDANEKLTAEFKKTRRADDVLCTVVSDEEKELEFYEFYCDTVSTVNKELIEQRKKKWDLKEVRKIKSRTLNGILLDFFPAGKADIDLLTIDVEGHDIHVLKSLDLNIFRPHLIVVEIDDFNFFSVNDNGVVNYLKENGYMIVAFDSKNGYFLNDRKN